MKYYNHRTRITAATLGILLSLAGCINHGIFEIMQGNTPTKGLFIEAIGKDHRFWIHGTEAAVTVVPNFLFTGIAVLLVGLVIIVWSLRFIHTKHGATVFLLLMLALTLVGGGIGHVVLFLPTWGYATRVNKPLLCWRKVLSIGVRKVLARLWKPTLVLTALSWVTVMELGIFGYFPGQTDPDVLLNITFGFLLLTVVLANLAFVFAFAGDIEQNEAPNSGDTSISDVICPPPPLSPTHTPSLLRYINSDEVKDLYEKRRACQYNRRIGHFNLTKRRSIERSRMSVGDSVIVFCCGTGLDFPYIQRKVGPTGKITGLDFSPNMLKEAERLIESEGWSNVELVEQDIQDLDERYDSRFDSAVCTLGLSIVPKYEQAYRKICASVCSDGQVIIGDMKLAQGFKSIFNPFTVSLAKRFGGSFTGHENVLKLRELMQQDLDDVIEEELMLGSYIILIGTKRAKSA